MSSVAVWSQIVSFITVAYNASHVFPIELLLWTQFVPWGTFSSKQKNLKRKFVESCDLCHQLFCMVLHLKISFSFGLKSRPRLWRRNMCGIFRLFKNQLVLSFNDEHFKNQLASVAVHVEQFSGGIWKESLQSLKTSSYSTAWFNNIIFSSGIL